MENSVYCLATSEPQANAILTHLRNLGFTSSEVSILLDDKKTKNISVKEDAIRGVEKGGLIGGALGAIAGFTALGIATLGPLMAAGPVVAALGGAAVGVVVGGLAAGSGALTHIGIPSQAADRIHTQLLSNGAILIMVHSADPVRRDKALRVFKSAGATEIYSPDELAA